MASVPAINMFGYLRSLYRQSSEARWAFASQVVTSGANFATSVVIIRALGLAEFGRFSVAFLIMMIVRNFLNGTVLTPMSAIAPKLREASAPAYRGFLLANGAVFGLLTSGILFGLAGALGWLIGSPWLPELALALACANLTSTGADFYRRYQFVRLRSFTAFLIDAIRYAVQLGLLLLLATRYQGVFDAQAALYAMAAAGVAAMVFGAAIYGRMAWHRGMTRAMWPKHWNFVKWMTPSVALETVQTTLPQFVATVMLGEAALGLIRAIQQFTNILNLPMNALLQLLPSIAAARLKERGYDALTRLLRKTGHATALMSGSLAAAVMIGSPALAIAMGIPDTYRFTVLLALYLALNFVMALRFPAMVLVSTVEDPNANFVSSLAGVIMSVLLSYPLIATIGEVSVPLLAIFNVLATWAILHHRMTTRDGTYRALGVRRSES